MPRCRKIILSVLALALLAGTAGLLLSIPQTDTGVPPMSSQTNVVQRQDFSGCADSAPPKPLRLLFIHHSCGGQLLAAPGADAGTNCIYTSHPNGGGLRLRLEQNSYEVHEASYGSAIGQDTDIFDWLPKFRTRMDAILSCAGQDASYPDDRRNQIVVFKSCFPNNNFVAEGVPPGNPAGPELTVGNARAAYAALLDEFKKHPRTLFVCVTAPPLACKKSPEPRWKLIAKKILGRDSRALWKGPLAREFNNWLCDQHGWLNDSSLTNVVVFDYYDILTGNGASDFSRYPRGTAMTAIPAAKETKRPRKPLCLS